MISEQKLIDIIKTMIDYNMLSVSDLDNPSYVLERVNLYLEAKKFVYDNFKGCF